MALATEQLEQLIAHSTDIVVATDRRGTVVYYNDGAKRSLGYRADEVMGRFVGKLYPTVEEAKRVKKAMLSSAHGGADAVDAFQTTFLAKDGSQIPVAISGRIVRGEDGAEDGTIGFAKDLREILHKDQLATLGEVAVGLSHEINNPLSVILNQTELLERDVVRLAEEGDTSVEMERLDAIRREIGRISEIVHRLGEMVERDDYQTVDYIGPARMVDLRRNWEAKPDERLRGLRILVVDDDQGILRTLSEILEGDGCVVDTAEDGVEALEHVKASPFDVVLTDVVMPRMDGFDLFTALRRSNPDLPVLMMTAFTYDKDHIIKRSRLRGLKSVVFKKPVDPERLRNAILECVFDDAGDADS
jgi:PAS domain S-box-containing protein